MARRDEMERQQDAPDIIELGTASVDTHGPAILGPQEDRGFYTVGISDE
jgi:hypothetical protein